MWELENVQKGGSVDEEEDDNKERWSEATTTQRVFILLRSLKSKGGVSNARSAPGSLLIANCRSPADTIMSRGGRGSGRGGGRGGFASNFPPMGLTFAEIQAISREATENYPVRRYEPGPDTF